MNYNGWSNYETWRTNLELCEGLDIRDFGFITAIAHDERDAAVSDLAEALYEMADETVAQEARGWSADIARSFLAQVDWNEIAEHLVDDYITENPQDEEDAE